MNPAIARRDLLRVMAIGAAGVAAANTSHRAVAAETVSAGKKNRARYHANSPEVQTFYRVNRYPAK